MNCHTSETFLIYSLPAVHQRLKLLNRHVGAVRHWAAVRYSASLLKQMVDSLSPYVTQILVNGKMVNNGRGCG